VDLPGAGSTVISGVIGEPGDVDVFQVTTGITGDLIIRLDPVRTGDGTPLATTGLDTYLTVYDADGNFLDYDYDYFGDTGSQVTIDAVAGGTYYVHAEAYFFDSTGTTS